jgi:hypothetical protein
MSESLGFSLREAIYSRIIETGGCYVLIYSGRGEKLAFLSCLNKGSSIRDARKLVVDFSLKRLGENLTGERLVTVQSFPEASEREAPESYCLRIVREEVAKSGNQEADSKRLALIVDPSSLFPGREECQEDKTSFDRRLAFHKDLAKIAESSKGVSVVLMYDASLLSDRLMSELMKVHQPLGGSMGDLSPRKLKKESMKRINAGKCYREIVATQREVLLSDPASQSVALLFPMTDAIETVLPNDPLDVAHRDIAFANCYTAHVGACPYRSSSVASGCSLDPNVMRAVDTRGQSFLEGYPCASAIDYMVCDEKTEKKTDSTSDSKSDEASGSGALESVNDCSGTLAARNNPIPVRHASRNQRLRASAHCKATTLFK